MPATAAHTPQASAAALHHAVQGDGPALVLLHPAGLDHTAMRPLAEAMAASHRVVSVDLRGHGLSPDCAPGTRLADLAGDVASVIALAAGGRAAVLGVSLGGMVAQALALAHPQAVSALLLCGCTGTFADELRPMLRERGAAALRGGMAAVLDATLQRWFTPAALAHGASGAVAAVRARLLADRPANWAATWDAIAGHDALPTLGEVAVPTLVLAGERDAATPVPATQALAGAIPGARWTMLEGAPHMMQLECPGAFHAAVAAFLREAAPAAPARPAGQAAAPGAAP